MPWYALATVPLATFYSWVLSSDWVLIGAIAMLRGVFARPLAHLGIVVGIAGIVGGFYVVLPALTVTLTPTLLAFGLWLVLTGVGLYGLAQHTNRAVAVATPSAPQPATPRPNLLGPLLAQAGHYVIAPDLRGRGLSSKPAQGYGIAFHAADLVGLSEALGLGGMDLVGHSLGGAIAMYLTAVYPARVRKLVVVDAGGKVPEDTAQAIGASVSRLGTAYPSLDAYLGLMRQLPMIGEWTPFWEDYFRYDAQVLPDGTVVSRVPRKAIEEESLALGLTRTEALPDLVRKPTLLVRATVGLLGPDRGFILPREEAERVRDSIAGCRLVELAGTNHYTVVTVPEFAVAVGEFLAPDV